jgi:NADPH-dependent curcumin reductase CurA
MQLRGRFLRGKVRSTCGLSLLSDLLALLTNVGSYYDNVGGETLEAALDNAATEARFIICGAITGYNEGYVPIKVFILLCRAICIPEILRQNVQNVLYRSISMHGFNVGRLAAKHGNENDFYKTFVPDVLAGKIK